MVFLPVVSGQWATFRDSEIQRKSLETVGIPEGEKDIANTELDKKCDGFIQENGKKCTYGSL